MVSRCPRLDWHLESGTRDIDCSRGRRPPLVAVTEGGDHPRPAPRARHDRSIAHAGLQRRSPRMPAGETRGGHRGYGRGATRRHRLDAVRQRAPNLSTRPAVMVAPWLGRGLVRCRRACGAVRAAPGVATLRLGTMALGVAQKPPIRPLANHAALVRWRAQSNRDHGSLVVERDSPAGAALTSASAPYSSLEPRFGPSHAQAAPDAASPNATRSALAPSASKMAPASARSRRASSSTSSAPPSPPRCRSTWASATNVRPSSWR